MKEKYIIMYTETVEMRSDIKRFESIKDANDWMNEQPDNICIDFAGEIANEFRVEDVVKVVTKELKKI